MGYPKMSRAACKPDTVEKGGHSSWNNMPHCYKYGYKEEPEHF